MVLASKLHAGGGIAIPSPLPAPSPEYPPPPPPTEVVSFICDHSLYNPQSMVSDQAVTTWKRHNRVDDIAIMLSLLAPSPFVLDLPLPLGFVL